MSDASHFDPNPAPPKKGWFGRNWLWFLPVAGLSMSCFCCLGCGGIIFGVLQTLKSSEPYQMALAHVQADAEVRALLGEPIVEAGFMPVGEVNVENEGGSATLYFHVKGPNGEAAVSTSAVRENGQWRLTYVEVAPSDGSSSPIVWPADAAWQEPLDTDLQVEVDLQPSAEEPAADDATSEPPMEEGEAETPDGEPEETSSENP